MFRSRNLEPNKIHLRALQLAHENSRDITFKELLMKDNSVCAHQKNLQILATEMFKQKIEYHLNYWTISLFIGKTIQLSEYFYI